MRAGGTTAVLVTHDQDEALSVADQVAVIRDGTIGQRGTPQELYDHPVDPAMARFLGDANLVAATVEGDRVSTPFGPLELRLDPPRPASRRAGRGAGPAGATLLSTEVSGAGLRASVIRTQFHGHDTVITVDPTGSPEVSPITVRAEGDLVVADGTVVEITADGTAIAWPARAG